MATAAATRPSGPVLPIPNFGAASPSRIKLAANRSPPAKSVSYSSPPASPTAAKTRRSCMCSPTNHPGSFRCSLHKEDKNKITSPGGHGHGKTDSPPPPPPPAVASTGAGVRDGVGSRVLARRALARSRQSPQRRYVAAGGSFRLRPSRLSAGSFSRDRAGDNRL